MRQTDYFFYQPFIAWDSFYIKKGQLIHVFEKWGLEYKIEFDFMVKKVPSDWTNIVHFIHGTAADRIPAIYLIANNTVLQIFYGVNPYHDYRVVYTLNQKYHVVVKQFKVAEKYMYEIEVDNATVHSFENQQAEHFSDVKFYAGSPWSQGTLTNDIALFENFEIFQ